MMIIKNELMTREEKCKLAIEKGYTYDPETGVILNKCGKVILTLCEGYIRICICIANKTYNLKGHQFAWYWVHKECVYEIDHINGIRSDNRISNLRSVTRQQNQWNRKTAKGYYIYKYKDSIYYNAQIYINTKRIRLGSFKTEQEARNAYLKGKKKYHII